MRKNVMKKTIGIIGFGNMGSAIAERIKSKYKILVFDIDRAKTENIRGVKVAQDIISLIEAVDVVILAVKPQDFHNILDEIKGAVTGKLIISIAAGISTRYIEKYLGAARIVRVMPNLPVRIGKGMSCIAKGKFSKDKDLKLTEEIFNKVGKTLLIAERLMDAATAVSGSGPGFYFDFIDAKQDEHKRDRKDILEEFILLLGTAAKKVGFTSSDGEILANTTGMASEFMVVHTKASPSELKSQVASKGGTTEAGLEVLHKGGSLEDAVKAALRRARELSKS